MRFVSHLDMNRFMARMLRLSGLPVWYTEGFHPHPFITFALPLSLGFESEYEVMDFRLIQDDYPLDKAFFALSGVMPAGIRALKLAEPQKKPGEIAAARFRIAFASPPADFEETLRRFLGRSGILVEKKNKKGAVSVLDIAPKMKNIEVLQDGKEVLLQLELPAGGTENLNPSLVLRALESECQLPPYSVCRTKLLDQTGADFC